MMEVQGPHWRLNHWFKDLSDEQYRLLAQLHKELLRFNEKLNLISERTRMDADLDHFADCILAWRHLAPMEAATKTIYDFGSGNGFPGLVLAILDKDKKLILVERDERKSEYLKYVAGALKLTNVKVLRTSMENLPEGSVECAISRGFASVARSLLVARKVLALGGRYYHMKGSGWVSELAELPAPIFAFWKAKLVADYELPSIDEGPVRLALLATTKTA